MNFLEILYYLPAILIGITFHEYAHALAADKLGDYTPRLEGRLTLNPIKHIDIIGFIALLIFHFGWAKPVPVNIYNLRNPPRDMIIIAFAGPLSNIIIAFISFVLLKFLSDSEVLKFLLSSTITINIFLFAFNLIPLPPLDGWRILSGFFPNLMFNRNLEIYGFIALLFIIFFLKGLISSYLFFVYSLTIGIFKIIVP
ncbi:MAG: site-2 protease family protein [candidate division WOR-3 bacterium]|nr:site-2 protease family protein [candidate division WOR-3 bacterium]MDW8150943.1 site-2 protease family protein [candidate division WOR-3 bacterium]